MNKENIFLSSLFIAGLMLNNAGAGIEEVAENEFYEMRKEMVSKQIEARGIKDKRVINAMLKVPRHKFVPSGFQFLSYIDGPVPIGEGQTISQPYIVALMTELLGLKGPEKVLEIGTGSGYQAAILAELAKKVYSVEILKPLAKQAEALLNSLGYKNIEVKWGDGYQGWKEFSPFDAIIITCAPPAIPQELFEQLKEGGRMVVPVGGAFQELVLVIKKNGKMETTGITPVAFVPMVKGEAR